MQCQTTEASENLHPRQCRHIRRTQVAAFLPCDQNGILDASIRGFMCHASHQYALFAPRSWQHVPYPTDVIAFLLCLPSVDFGSAPVAY